MRQQIPVKRGFRDRPYTIKLELVKGCTRACDFCAINKVIKPEDRGKFSFSKKELIIKVAKECNTWLGKYRIEMGLRGEPLKHPHIIDVVKLLKEHSPKAHLLIFTNGDTLLKNDKWDLTTIKGLFDAGLNALVLDSYDKKRVELSKVLKGQNLGDIKINIDGNCFNYKPKRKEINLTGITALGNQNIRNWHNVGGNLPKESAKKYGVDIDEPLVKSCVKPFRELTITWDGNVCLCCLDWSEDIKFGNITKESLQEIYYSRKMDVVRELLTRKQRIFNPCKLCSHFGGFRKGMIVKPNLPEKTEELLKELK